MKRVLNILLVDDDETLQEKLAKIVDFFIDVIAMPHPRGATAE